VAYEIDFLPVGDAGDSGDAIALRFAHPTTGTWVHVIVDAGFGGDGDDLVRHVKRYYETDQIDLAILTHPDADHIGGMGEVVRGLSVERLWLHDIGAHGGESLRAAKAVNDLIEVAQEQGTTVEEAWGGAQALDGALTVLGPSKDYYEELVQEQVSGISVPATAKKALVEAARGIWDRIGGVLGDEVPFPEKEVTPRNNSAMITLLKLDGDTLLLTSDAGVPALERAWDLAEEKGLAAAPDFLQIPHHGSRRNASSAWLDRLLGGTGQEACREAIVSVVPNSEKHPSGKVINAYIRRGCNIAPTAGDAKWYHRDTPARLEYHPISPLQPMQEEDDD
jgi:beta-lactamase superfamily II metal-dependent hydrolase